MESQMKAELQEHVDSIAEDVAHEWREEMVENLENSYQGAPGLLDFMSEVIEVGEEYHIRIRHPAAPLHEKGGHIEPRYAQAMSLGWTRDGFYEGLQDCEEWVKEKRYARKAAYSVRRTFR